MVVVGLVMVLYLGAVLRGAVLVVTDAGLGRWAERFGLVLGSEGRELARRQLRRATAWRLGGAAAGVVVGALLTVGWVVAGVFTTFGWLAWTAPLVGLLLGVVAGELSASRLGEGPVRAAVLYARRVADYVPGLYLGAARVVAVLLVAAVPAYAWAATRPQDDVSLRDGVPTIHHYAPWPVAAAVVIAAFGLLALGGTALLARRVVARRQPATDPELVAVDDALRSTAAHAVLAVGLTAALLALALLTGMLGGTAPLAGRAVVGWPTLLTFLCALGTLADLSRPGGFRVRHPEVVPA